MENASTHCIPCRKGEPTLTQAEAGQALATVPGWALAQEGKAITRRFAFKDYAQALAFVTALSAVAEAENHHPDIAFGWGYAEVTFTTHSIGGLHRNDIIMAAKTNLLDEGRATA